MTDYPVPKMSSTNLSSNHNTGELGLKAFMMEQNLAGRILQQNKHTIFGLTSHEEPNTPITKYETEKSGSPALLRTLDSGASISDQDQSLIVDSRLYSISSICPTPICRQFWKAGNYDSRNSMATCQNGTGHLRVHPKFLHSNATSHKWVFGAMAELLDNSVDEIRNGATSVIVDKILNPRDGTPALLIQDDGGGMDPEAMRRCLSFGFSDKKYQNTIGKYGNGFKTSSMRLGADVVVFSRCKRDRRLTQSVGLLSYTFLMCTRQDKIVVPIVDYLFDADSGTWNTLQDEQRLNHNLSILFLWSPVSTEAELLKQCDDISPNGTKIIIYNLWHDDEGAMELDFDSDPEDIRIAGNFKNIRKSEQHLANRFHCSLRAYLSILYLRVPLNFRILLRGRVVEYHNIATDLIFPEFILYKPYNVEGSVITTIGFLKEAPAVNVHGFNVYYKNRLILPFWHVLSYSNRRGKGVVGVLEANFIEPTHNKQDFEKTPVFQKLEARLKAMTIEYWDCHCGLIGYYQYRKPRVITNPQDTSNSGQGQGIPVVLGQHSGSSGGKTSFVAARSSTHDVVSGYSDHMAAKSERPSSPIAQDNTQGTSKRKHRGQDHSPEIEGVERRGITGSRMFDSGYGGDEQLENQGDRIIQENKRFRSRCKEYERTDKELDLKITRLKEEVLEAQRELARMLLESRLLEKIEENRKLLLV